MTLPCMTTVYTHMGADLGFCDEATAPERKHVQLTLAFVAWLGLFEADSVSATRDANAGTGIA